MGDADRAGDERRQAEFLANRLEKRDKHLRKWAKREGIDAYRVYDRDIPEIPLAVDRYGDALLLALYERPYDKPEDEERRWLSLMTETAAKALGVDPAAVRIKTRKRQRGDAQYEREGASGAEFAVRECGLRFLVNLDDYLDTGLFLDHRPTRGLVRNASAGRRVLNLFCYTGSFSVYAASGGATEVDSVDLSTTYLDWTRRNLELNGFKGDRFRQVRLDARLFMKRAADEGRRYGVVVIDPPTFSNSKRAPSDFDVRRDWEELVTLALDVLEPDGRLYFSTNARRFAFEPDAVPGARCEDLSDSTTPPDFRGRPHRAWLIRPAD